MIERNDIEHHIQKHIVGVLMYEKYARFRDLCPPKIDTNLFNYHLKLLQKRGFVHKSNDGYTLDKKGILYVDRVSTSTLTVRTQPKIIVMLFVQNKTGDLLVYRRIRQPYTNQWTLPYGKLHIDDETLEAAASREAREKLGITVKYPVHVADCYIRIKDGEETVMTTLAHVFRAKTESVVMNDRLAWAPLDKLTDYNLAPAVDQIVVRVMESNAHFFEEYTQAW